MNFQTNARNSNTVHKHVKGDFDMAMGYGWASNEAAWEKIISRASWGVVDARATLSMIRSMEQAGVADLPRAAYHMRTAARIASKTIRENTMRSVYPKKVVRR